MDLMTAVGDLWVNTVAWLAGLAVVFGVLARAAPCNPGMYWWTDRRAVATDVVYWFLVPLLLLAGRAVLLIAAVVVLFGGREPDVLPVRDLPLWAQCGAILVTQDFILYWAHRLFHTRPGWRFHAVHHSPEVLDWTSVTRFHPVNHLLEFAVADAAVLLLGFAPATLAVLAPFNLVYSAMVHANLNWTFGPLRYVLASPVFHRWHHTSQAEGRDKNFAPTFPALDLIFGTFYLPAGRRPEVFGVGDPGLPGTFLGQLVYPFRGTGLPGWARRRPAAAMAAAGMLVGLGVLGVREYDLTVSASGDEPGSPPVDARPDTEPGPAYAAVAVSADGRRFVGGAADGAVGVWDGETGREVRTFPGHTRRVTGLAVTADGRWVVSGSLDRTVRVWDVAAGKEARAVRMHAAPVSCVAVSDDGRRVAAGAVDGTVAVWDAGGRDELLPADEPAAVSGVAVGGDGRLVVAAAGCTATVYDAGRGTRMPLRGHTDLVYGVALSPDGGRAVTASFDGRVTVWDARTGEALVSLAGHAGPVYCVAVSPDGRRVASGGADRTVRVWDIATGAALLTLPGHADAVRAVGFTADGGRVMSASLTGGPRVWDARDGRPVPAGSASPPPGGAELLPVGHWVPSRP